jgi:dTMP kinase
MSAYTWRSQTSGCPNFYDSIVKGVIAAQNITRALLEDVEHDDQHRFASIIVLRKPDDPEVLVVRREFPPEEGKWACPGGHAEEDEKMAEAAKRELKEETGLDPDELVYMTTTEVEDRRDADVAFYYCVVDTDDKAHAGDDAEKIKWLKVSDLPELAFNNNEYIKQAVQKAFDRQPVSESRVEGKYGREGLLIVFEGIDGAGKTTQVRRLTGWLGSEGYKVKTTKWNSSDILSNALYRAKKHKELSPILFSVLHAADLTWRYENIVQPNLDKGKVVICDRYYYTSYVRDGIRGVNDGILDIIYDDWRKPDIIFYCKVPVRIAVERLLRDKGVYYYSAGKDAGYKGSKEECAMQYEADMDRRYAKLMAKEDSVVELDMERPIKEIAKEIRKALNKRFKLE